MRLIDADALLEHVQCRLHFDDVISKTIDKCVEITRRLISDAPTIEAEPVRHGRWIDAYCGKYANAKYICSCCGKRAHSDDWKWELSDFCPHCGAKMDGGTDDATD